MTDTIQEKSIGVIYTWRFLKSTDDNHLCEGCEDGCATWFVTSDKPMGTQEWFCQACASEMLKEGNND